MRPKLLLLTIFTVIVSFIAKANDVPPGTGEENIKKAELAGGVHNMDTKRAISAVTVTAYHLSTKKEKVTLTDANGNYAFDDLQAGTYKFIFAKSGYKKVTKDKVVIRQDETFQMDIEMSEHSSFDFMPGPFHLSEFER